MSTKAFEAACAAIVEHYGHGDIDNIADSDLHLLTGLRVSTGEHDWSDLIETEIQLERMFDALRNCLLALDYSTPATGRHERELIAELMSACRRMTRTAIKLELADQWSRLSEEPDTTAAEDYAHRVEDNKREIRS